MTAPLDPAALGPFFDDVLDGIAVVDDDRRYVYVNPAFAAILDQPAAEVIGRRIDDVFEGPVSLDVLWAAFLQAGSARNAIGYRRPSGELRLLETASRAAWRPGWHLSVVRDITARRDVEQAHEAQLALTASLAAAPTLHDAAERMLEELTRRFGWDMASFWLLDRAIQALRCECRWTLPGSDPHMLAAVADLEVLEWGQGMAGAAWQRLQRVVAFLDAPLEEGAPQPLRAARLRAAGLATAMSIPVFRDDEFIGAFTLFSRGRPELDPRSLAVFEAAAGQVGQVIGRRWAEGQLDRLVQLTQRMPVGTVVLRPDILGDGRTYRLVIANDAARSQAPPLAAGVGRRLTELFPALASTSVLDQIAAAQRAGRTADLPELDWPGPEPAAGRFAIRVVPLPDDVVGVLFEEISERHRHEVARERYATALEQAVAERAVQIADLERARALDERLAATGRIAAAVAHEINNPLAAIKSAFALVKDGLAPDHPHASYVPRIEREIERIARIVGRMTDVYRPIAEPVVMCDLGVLLGELLEELAPRATEAAVRMRCDAIAQVRIESAELALRQILRNLVINAIEATPRGGAVRIRIEPGPLAIAITVADDGPGIAPGIVAEIWEPFRTTKRGSGGGLGLGLAIARSMADGIGARLELADPGGNGHGAVFRLNLPRNTG